MFTTDHVFDSTPLWSDLRRAPGAGFDTDCPRGALVRRGPAGRLTGTSPGDEPGARPAK